MSLSYSQRNGMVVAEHGADERAIAAELKKFDSDLILMRLDRDFEPGAERVWQVRKWVSRDREPVLIVSWTDDYGNPIPLSSGLLEKVKSLRGAEAMRAIDKHNQKIREDAKREQENAERDIAQDMMPRLRGRSKAVLPRSQALRMSRDKRRRQGDKGL